MIDCGGRLYYDVEGSVPSGDKGFVGLGPNKGCKFHIM